MTLKLGDQVLLSTEGLRLRGDNKLCARYLGPFPIIEVVNANAYKLQLPVPLQALHPTFNIDRLKLYRDGRARFPDRPMKYSRPPPEAESDTNGDKRYEVEEILAKRRRGRAPLEYLISWKRYPPEEATWERASGLVNADEAIALFEQRQQASQE